MLFVLGPFSSGKPAWKCLIRPMIAFAALWILATWWMLSLVRMLRVILACSTGPFFTGYWYEWSWRYIAGLQSKTEWWKRATPISFYEKWWWPREKNVSWPPAFVLLMFFVALFWATFTGLGAYEFYQELWRMNFISSIVWAMNIFCVVFVIAALLGEGLAQVSSAIVKGKEAICPKVQVDA